MSALRTPEQLEQALRDVARECYHDQHPFHALMVAGKLTKGQLQAWALNRYYYQARIPIKDATMLTRLHDPEMRREWRQRILDHDGDPFDEGGIQRWLALTAGLGLDRDYVMGTKGILPATRFACDAYVSFVRERSVLEAVASSLTEMFSPGAIQTRVSGLLANYDFIGKETLAYFDKRMTQAPRDANFALEYVKREASTPELRELVCETLRFKCSILWTLSDAIYLAYIEPGFIPPGAFDPDNPGAAAA